MDKSQSVPWMVTIFRGDEQYTVPIWVAMKVHFQTPEWLVRRGELLSDAQLLAEGVEAGDIFCPDLTWEELSGELSRVVGRGDTFGPPGEDPRVDAKLVESPALLRLMEELIRRLAEEHPVTDPPPVPGGDRFLFTLKRELLAQLADFPRPLLQQPYRPAPDDIGPFGPRGPRGWPRAQRQRARAIDLVPFALRRAAVGLTSLALAEVATGEVSEAALSRQLDALRRAMEDCGTLPRPRGWPWPWPWPPWIVLAGLSRLLPVSRVQLEVSRLTLEVNEQIVG